MKRVHIYRECKNEECPSHKDKSLGNICGDTLHHITVEDGREIAKCDVCSEIFYFRDPDNVSKGQYPAYNASLGMTFESRAQELKYAKDNGYTVKDFRAKDRARKSS